MTKLKNKIVAVGMSALLSVCCCPTLALADDGSQKQESWTNGILSLFFGGNDADEGSDVEMLVSPDGWQEYSGIEWNVNGDILIIQPLDYITDTSNAGMLGTEGGIPPWCQYPYTDTIQTVVFNGQINAGTSLDALFNDCRSITSFNGLENVNTSSTTSMMNAFGNCSSLTQLSLPWNTDAVQNMSNMFSGCTSLTTLDISSMSTQNATDSSQNVFPDQLTQITVGYGFTLWSQLPGGPWVGSDGVSYPSGAEITAGAGTYIKVQEAQSVQGVSFAETTKQLSLNGTFTLTPIIEPSGAQYGQISWSSENESVATVTDGVVTAVGLGETRITVTIDGYQASCLVTVTEGGSGEDPVTPPNPDASITLSDTELTLTGKETKTLTATTNPADALVVWSSSDPEVATVDSETGEITPKAKGTVTITAETSSAKAECAVTILNPATSVSINMPGTLKIDTEVSVTATLTGALDGEIDPIDSIAYEWSITPEDKATATPNESGTAATIKATSLGEATLSVTASAEGMTIFPAVSKFIVTEDDVEVSVTVDPAVASVAEGETVTLSATVEPSALQTELSWSSKDEDIATVNRQGVVTGVKAGRTEIIASAGGKSATCTLTVTAPGEESPTVESITFNPNAVTLTGKDSQELSVQINPSSVTVADLVWTSSNESIVIVDEGTVTAVSKGSATVTASSADGKVSATCQVTVLNPPSGITADVPSVLKIGDTAEVQASIEAGALPGETDPIDSYSWEAVDSSVVVVTAKSDASAATIEAKAIGSTEVVVTAAVGQESLTAKMPIQVAEADVESVTLSETEKTVAVGSEPFTLTATVLPELETPFTVTWESSDSQVASVDESGVVTPEAIGSAVITAKAGNIASTCTVTVTPMTLAASPASTVPGSLVIKDAATAKTLSGLSLNISDQVSSTDDQIKSALQATAGSSVQFLNAYNIHLVNESGTEIPWSDPEHTVEVNISVSDSITSMVDSYAIGVFYIDDAASAAESMKTWIESDTLTFETTHFSTYALAATPLTDDQPNDDNTGGDATQIDSGDANKGNYGDALKGLASTGDLMLSNPGFLIALAVLGVALGIVVIVQSCNAGKRSKGRMRR